MMIGEYFTWAAGLAKTSPFTYAVVNVGTMVVLGVAIGLIADGIFRLLRVDLGSYKKEFEDESAVIKQ
jgi:hypothetical protein